MPPGEGTAALEVHARGRGLSLWSAGGGKMAGLIEIPALKQSLAFLTKNAK